MTAPIRVRYAPSPTGYPHVGNIRTAIFNWLFARHQGGSFILRLEDTDLARTVEGAAEAILESLLWLGLDWDEGPEVGGAFGPYIQSQRLPLYHETAGRLLRQGAAYLCYCSPERLDQMRAEQARRKQPPGYDRRCRELSPDERKALESSGVKPVVRFKIPLEGQTTFTDIIRGEVTFQNSTLDDFVLLKSDGYPTYHLANIVDDHEMQVSDVLRAEEWLSSTPRHLLLYAAMGYEPPRFAHLPMILGPDRSKLSKRHGATALLEFREQGYLPEAMLNFLTLLGWSLDDHTELMSREEIVSNFSLERVSQTAAIFNHQKLEWMNGVYIRHLSPDEFTRRMLPFLEKGLPPEVTRPVPFEYARRLAPLIQERTKTLAETVALTDFFFVEQLQYEASLLLDKGLSREMAIQALKTARERIETLDQFDSASLEGLLRPLATGVGMNASGFFGLLRVAVTGRKAAPPLFQTMEALGRQRCLDRMEMALAGLQR
ncbi:MAG: glutamate--tRNA ligase [Dehalococcoidia bacterium]|nr:glutamate--tRNA ligase [Dehalococcoidia bacterium]